MPAKSQTSPLTWLRLHLHPVDSAILAILIIAILTSAAATKNNPTDLHKLLAIHIALSITYIFSLLILTRYQRHPWTAVAHPLIAMTTLWTLYCTLGWLGMAAMPFRADAALSHIDAFFFHGTDPTFLIQKWQTPHCVEFFAFFYGLFIPYIDFSLLLGAVGRPPLERDQFLTGWVFTYCISYLGYIFLPATGPGGFHTAQYAVQLHGGYFFNLVVTSVANTGGLRGVFPSLHVGSALYLCLFDLRTNRLRGLTYLPIVLLIYGATIILRYHYLFDLLIGTTIAATCVRLGPRTFLHWAQARYQAGLQPLPAEDDNTSPDLRYSVTSNSGFSGGACPARPPATDNKTIFKPTHYQFFRLLAKLSLRLFFRQIETEGAQLLPPGPILLVSNHTNALVDPLLPLTTLRRRITLTGKNVLNKNPLLALIGWATGSISFHRAEDTGKGADPRQNVRAMQRCREVLSHNGAICIFPEGISHSDLKMREFHTGAARIALDFVRKDQNPGNLSIVPMGLLYTAKDQFRSNVWLRFGQPLDVAKWMTDHPHATTEDLTEEIRRQIEALTIGYENRRELLIVHWANTLLQTETQMPRVLGTPKPAVAASFQRLSQVQSGYRRLRATHSAEIDTLTNQVRDYRAELKRRGINPAEVYLPLNPLRALLFLMRELELLLLGAPLVLFGFLNHLLPYLIVRTIARRLSKDKDHWATNVIYPSFVVFPFFYCVQLTAALLFLPPIWAMLYTIALPFTGYYAILFSERTGSAGRRAMTFIYFLLHPKIQRQLADQGRAILNAIHTLANYLQPETKTP